MQTLTSRFGIPIPGTEDYYDITDYQRAMEILDSNAVKGEEIGKIKVLTEETYGTITPSEGTLYIVTGDKDFTMYLGDKPLASGGAITPAPATLCMTGYSGTIGTANASYTEVGYIQSSGTQYINAEFTPSSRNLRYVVTFSDFLLSDDYGMIFAGYSSGARCGGIVGNAAVSGTALKIPIGSGDYLSIENPSGIATWTISLNGYELTVDTGDTTETATITGNVNAPMYLFADGAGTHMGSVKLYGMQIYQDDALVRDFVPALDGFGAACLYDRVSGGLFKNAGSGALGYGTEV